MTLDALGEPIGTAAAPLPEPPKQHLTPRQWVRANLFPNIFSGVLTVVFAAIAVGFLFVAVRWVLVTADWAIVRVNLRQFMVGRDFPTDQYGRLWGSLYVLAVTVGLAVGILVGRARAAAEEEATSNGEQEPPTSSVITRVAGTLHRFWPAILAVVVVLSFTRTPLPAILTAGAVAVFLVARFGGGRLPMSARRFLWPIVLVGLYIAFQVTNFGENGVGWEDWGGLHMTVFATVAGITLAFPLGLLLALGRRGSLPALRLCSIAYIELFRAVPLIILLFLAINLLGFLLPQDVSRPSDLTLAIIAITLFEAAYIAEIVRGGLQSVPRGQMEAAQAIGLRPAGVQRLVVLPQALRAVIPAMVGQFISLFKDTSLLSVISLVEITRVAEAVLSQRGFFAQNLYPVTLTFVGLLYWAGCATMSRESRRLERRLGVGER